MEELILDLSWTDMLFVDRQARAFWGRGKHEQRN